MPAKSKKQRRFFGMVRGVQSGEIEAPSPEIAAAAESTSASDASHFAETPEKGLPETKQEKKAMESLANFLIT